MAKILLLRMERSFELVEFYTLLAFTLVTMMTPGPDFVIVVRNTLVGSRKAGFKTALGISSAIWVHIGYSIVLINLASSQSAWLMAAMKYMGAAYLFYLGINALRSQQHIGKNKEEPVSSSQYWRQGFINNLLNPKATLFFLSLFSQVIAPGTGIAVQLGYGVLITLLSVSWFSLVSILLTVPRFEPWLERVMLPFEKIAGMLFIGFAVAIVI